MVDDRPEPVSMWPDSMPIVGWRQRIEPPAVKFRCGQGNGQRQCKPIAFIFETPLGAVVQFHQHRPDAPVRFSGPTRQELAQAGFPDVDQVTVDQLTVGREVGGRPGDLKYAHGDQPLMRGWTDRSGTVVGLEDDRHWSNVVTPSCRQHLGRYELTRSYLMKCLRDQRQQGRTRDVTLNPHLLT